MSRTRALLASLCLAVCVCCASADDPKPAAKFTTKTIRGRVVWLADSLARLHGIKTVPEAAERTLVLETADGALHPLVEDIRGRAFRRDKRLRNIDVELFVRQFDGSPMVQAVRVFELTEGEKLEIDYWCEICSIAMFELKECDCCQGPIELRRRAAKDARN